MTSPKLVSGLASLSLLTALFATGCAETTTNTPSANAKSPQHTLVLRERAERDR